MTVRRISVIASMSILMHHLVMFLVQVQGGRSWVSTTRRGDGTWYLYIAQHGYSLGQKLGDTTFYSPKSDLVFYPVLPGLTRLISFSGLSIHASAVLVVSTAAVVATVWLFKFLELSTSTQVAFTTAVLWITQPFVVVLVTILTESLFAMFTILTLYFWKQNKKFIASFFLLADCLTRTTGAAIALTVIAVYLILSLIHI